MSTNVQFPLSYVINVTILPTPTGVSVANINTLCLFTNETPLVPLSQGTYDVYLNASTVATAWGTNSNCATIANYIFSQQPNLLGTQGYLVIVPRIGAVRANVAVQNITYTAVASGSAGDGITVAYTTGGVAGAEAVTVAGTAISVAISSGVSTAAQIIAAIQANIAANALVHVYSASPAMAQTGPVAATNLANGAGETVQAAMIRTQNQVYYFGVMMDEEENYGTLASATFPALAAYVQSQNKIMFYASSSIPDFQNGGIEANVQAASQDQVRCLYYGNLLPNGNGNQQTQVFAGAYAGRALSTNFTGTNTCTTMNLKKLVNITPDNSLSAANLLQVQAAGVDVYVNFGGLIGLYISGENEYFDQVYDGIALQFALQVGGANFLAGTNTKIQQTDSAMRGYIGALNQVMNQFVVNGFLAPGTWTSPDTFGNPTLFFNNILGFGYYTFAAPMASQTAAQRDSRAAPLVQIAAKESGALHSSDIIVLLNP